MKRGARSAAAESRLAGPRPPMAADLDGVCGCCGRPAAWCGPCAGATARPAKAVAVLAAARARAAAALGVLDEGRDDVEYGNMIAHDQTRGRKFV